MASALSFGNLPVDYEVIQNEYMLSKITTENIQKAIVVVAIITVVALLVLILDIEQRVYYLQLHL